MHGARSLLPAILGIWVWLCVGAPAQAIAPPWEQAKREAAASGQLDRWDAALKRRRAILARHVGRDPAAALALFGVFAELQGELEPGKLRRFLNRVADDKRRNPLVRSYAGLLLGRLDEAAGDVSSAKDRLEGEGYLLAWQIVGPFENAGRKGEAAVYAPQTEPFSPDQTFTGKLPAEPLSWRARDYDAIPRGAYVSFDDLLRPNRHVTGYATCWVYAPKAMAAALHVGSGGPYDIWLQDEAVGSGSAYRIAHPLQESHALGLAQGWNRLLVKVSALEGMWGFYARISDPRGAPIAGLKTSSAPPAEGMATGKRPSTKPILSIRGEFEKKGGLRLVEFYRHAHPFDKDDHTAVELARKVDAKAKSSRSAWMLALADRDQSGSDRALRDAIARARKEGTKSRGLLGRLLLELAWRQRSLGLEETYQEQLELAWDASPSDPVIELARIDRVAEQGYAWLAVRWISELAKRHPYSQSIRAEYASRLRAQGRPVQALEELQALAKQRGGAQAVSGARIDALLDLGRADEAAKLGHRVADAAPGLPSSHAMVARLEEARGDREAARAALAKAIALAPQDAELHRTMGQVLIRANDTALASASLRRSLDLLPQQPDLRDLLATLGDKTGRDLFDRYAVGLEKVAKSKVPASWKGKSAGYLHHRVAVKVLPNGLTERLDHRIIRVLDDRGVRGQAIQAIAYDPAESMVEVRRARVRRKNGTIEEIGNVRVVALANAGFRMYYDQRQIRVTFPGLRVGDTLEVAFLQRDVAARNMFDEYFGDIMPVQGFEPRKLVEYILEAPGDKPIYFNVDVSKKKTKRGLVYRYRAKDVAGIKPEPSMPGWTEVATYLHASTYKTWDDVGRWYWDLVREQLVVDESVKKAVKAATATLAADADDRAKADAIYDYVVRNTRYVGLEFGIHGYKPYRTTEVLSRRFGDCKDKASLLKVMLKEVGIDSHLVLVRTRDQGTVPKRPASLAVFNHAITYIPKLDLWLDGTAEWAGTGELPAGDQGATVLVVRDGKGAQFRRIPVTSAAANLRATKQVISLRATGAAEVKHQTLVTGSGASALRLQFHAPEARDERVAKAFGDVYAGARVRSVKAPGIEDIGQAVRLDIDLEVPGWARPTGDRMRFAVLGRDSTQAPTLAALPDREYDLILEVPSTERHELRYELPRGHKFTQLPAPKSIESPLGRFVLDVNKVQGGAEVKSTLELRKQRIGAKDYNAFREFLRQVDAALEQTFEVAPAR